MPPNEGNPQWPLRGDASGETLDGACPKGSSEKPLRGSAPVRELTGEAWKESFPPSRLRGARSEGALNRPLSIEELRGALSGRGPEVLLPCSLRGGSVVGNPLQAVV